MKYVLLSLLLVTACAGRERILRLQPINASGDYGKSIRAGRELIEIGLVERGATTTVVRVLADGRLVELFAIPRHVPGVPSNVIGFEYAIDPGPAVAGEPEVPGRFTLVAGSSVNRTIYETTWVFTWNAARGRFDVSAPTTTHHEVGPCEVCDSATA